VLKLTIILLLFLTTEVLSSTTKIEMEYAERADAWMDAKVAFQSNDYYLIQIQPLGKAFIPSITANNIGCWEKKYELRGINLSDYGSYETLKYNHLIKLYASEFNRIMVKQLIHGKIESSCGI
jgi:hypothetical protein